MVRWVAIAGFENYEVSEYGDIKNIGVGRGIKPGRILRRGKDPCGYQEAVLCKNGKHHYFLSHRLVAYAFLGPCPADKCYVCHRDGNPFNNHYSNLYWATQKENMEDMIRHGRSTKGKPAHNKGKPCSIEQRAKISATLKNRYADNRC